MTVNDERATQSIPPTPGSRAPLPSVGRPSSRTYLLLAVVLVVVVITVSTIARSTVPKSLATAQQHYLRDVTHVEEADVVFNEGASTPPNHSATSTRTLALALGKEFNELQAQKWPNAAAANIAHLAQYTRVDYQILGALDSASSATRHVLLHKESILLGYIESTNISVLKELKLPTPTNVSRPAAPATKAS